MWFFRSGASTLLVNAIFTEPRFTSPSVEIATSRNRSRFRRVERSHLRVFVPKRSRYHETYSTRYLLYEPMQNPGVRSLFLSLAIAAALLPTAARAQEVLTLKGTTDGIQFQDLTSTPIFIGAQQFGNH